MKTTLELLVVMPMYKESASNYHVLAGWLEKLMPAFKGFEVWRKTQGK